MGTDDKLDKALNVRVSAQDVDRLDALAVGRTGVPDASDAMLVIR